MSGTRKGTGGGPTVVFAAHMDTVFPEGTDVTVKREGDILRAPGVGDDTGNLVATLEMFRALNRANIQTKGDLVFLASVQEEIGLLGAKFWLENAAVKPDMFIAVDGSASEVWYGALRINQFKFFYTSPGAHTLESREYAHPLPGGGQSGHRALRNQASGIQQGAWRLQTPGDQRRPARGLVYRGPAVARQQVAGHARNAVVSTAKRIGEQEGVGFRMERRMAIDYSRAKPQPERPNHPVVQTSLAALNHYRKPGTPAIVPADAGSTDANIAVSMGIPGVSIGAAISHMAHRLEETAEASTIVPGVKSLLALAVALTTH